MAFSLRIVQASILFMFLSSTLSLVTGKPRQECDFLWTDGKWTPCTASCAGGTQVLPAVCLRAEDDTIVHNSHCDHNIMPAQLARFCNVKPCPPIWMTGSWSACSVSCGRGHQTRTVECVRKMSQTENEIIDNRNCTSRKPRSRKVCIMQSCPFPKWHVGKWGACSAECGRGLRRRRVVCWSQETGAALSNECSLSYKPRTTTSCESLACSNTNDQCVDDVGYCPLVRKFKFCNRAYFKKTCCDSCSHNA